MSSTELANYGPPRSPFDSIKHTDENGDYWLAREMWEPAGYSAWRRFEDLVKRAQGILEGVPAGQEHIVVKDKKVSLGSAASREVVDYRCTRYGAYMILSRSDKPELADYFVMQTMFAENVQMQEALPPGSARLAEILQQHAPQLDSVGLYPDGSVRYAKFKRTFLPAPRITGTDLRAAAEELFSSDIRNDEANDLADKAYNNQEPFKPVFAEKLSAWLAKFFPAPKAALVASPKPSRPLELFASLVLKSVSTTVHSAFLDTAPQSWGIKIPVTEENVEYAVSLLDPSTIRAIFNNPFIFSYGPPMPAEFTIVAQVYNKTFGGYSS